MNRDGSGNVISFYHYQLRADGKRLSVTDGSGITNYTYDNQGKLTEENGPYADIQYGYDNVGNRLTRTVTNAATGNGTTLVNGVTNTTYDANDRIIGHTYDADSNETTVNGQTASYDFENHLVSLASAANNTVLASYAYDADGNRCSTYVSSNNPTTTSYVVDTSLTYASVVEEYTGGSATPSARYDYGDGLVRMDRTSPSVSTSYYLFDGLGSTRQLVNVSGAVTDTWGYSAFGEQVSRTGTILNPFLFNAQQFDAPTQTYYLRARYYDQSNGRFLSQDPYAGNNDDPISLHRYLYANNDPVDYYDASGGETEGEVLEASLDSQTIEGRSSAFYYKLVGTFIVGNPFALQNSALFVIGLVDPEFAYSLEGTFPQGDLGATGGIATSSAFKQLGRTLRGLFNADSEILSDAVIANSIGNPSCGSRLAAWLARKPN